MSKETMGFQTEVKQLLKLVINSLYSNKEIFLRELVSNGADACDKLRFEALADDKLYENDSELKINISADKDNKIIVIEDNGIGMNKTEIVDNIGTIAKSGTKSFFEKLTGDQKQDSNLIGQFGVGFYSAFIVADKVVVESRHAGDDAKNGVRWQSKGAGEFTLEDIKKSTHGTKITLHLKDDALEFAENIRLKTLINKYSEHIALPIMMLDEVPTEPTEAGKEDKKDAEPVLEWTQINKATALWQQPRNNLKDDDYKEFYKSIANDWQDPAKWIHAQVEGNLQYTQLLYIPSHAPFDLYERERTAGIKLYVKRVFIMEDTEKLMPNYLRFVRGVIDSNDLPLNVSREILQSSKIIDKIRKASVKKVLGMLESMAKNDKDEYQKFWNIFGQVLKEGLVEDIDNKDRIAKLCRFASTNGDATQNVSLEDYLARLQDKQDKIYYITSESYNAAKNSPHLEVFKKKKIEVLLLSDRIDEWVVSSLTEFDGKALQSVTQGDLDLDDKAEKSTDKNSDKKHDKLIKKIKKTLADKVEDIKISKRLTDSPACLVAGAGTMDVNMQRMMKQMGQEVPETKRILEINPEHPLVKHLENQKDEALFNDWSEVLLDQSVLAEGGQLEDPASFTHKLNGLLLALAK